MTEHHYERRKHLAFRTPSDSSVSHEAWLVHTTDAQGRWAMLPEVPAGANAAVQEQ